MNEKLIEITDVDKSTITAGDFNTEPQQLMEQVNRKSVRLQISTGLPTILTLETIAKHSP